VIIDTQSKLLCSVSQPPSDLAGCLYNEMIAALGINAAYLPTGCDSARAGFDGLDALGFCGFSVSMPYKQDIMACLDEIDDTARAIGAVNTAVKRDGKWRGYNTDWYGAVEAIQQETEIAGKRVLMLGAGGAARAIAYGIAQSGGELTINNRSDARGQALADEFGASYLSTAQLADAAPFDIVINATSMGFAANADVLPPLDVLHPGQIVLDIVLTPLETPFLKAAAERGAVPIPGYKMCIFQAILQFKYWLDVELEDYSAVETALMAFIEERGM
jgi:shikimate dehydrogenase